MPFCIYSNRVVNDYVSTKTIIDTKFLVEKFENNKKKFCHFIVLILIFLLWIVVG